MSMIHTAYGPGEIVAQETVRGRTQYQVAGSGFKVWLDEVEVSRRTASDPRDRAGDSWASGRDRDRAEHGQHDLDDFGDELGGALSHEFENPGYNHHAPGYDPHRDYTAWEDGGLGSHEAASSFDFEPTTHTFDNSTTLPYSWQPQFPVDMFRHEQTMSPDHQIDLKKRLKPSDSRSGEGREDPHTYPGPNPDLFAEKEGNLAGLSDKFIQIHEAADHFNDPIVRFRDDPVREIHRHGSIDVSAGLDPETGEWMNLVEADKQIRTAAWRDVVAKARRLRREGRVAVQDMDQSRIYANVKGDTGDYDVMILKGGAYGGVGGGQAITDWRCSCDWGKWAFKRQHTFVGRLCSHGYATYLTQQAAYLKDNPHHFKPKKKKGARVAGVDAFKTWVNKENGGHVDIDAADNYLATQDEPVSKEDAEAILDYVSTHHSERPERNYDVKGYTYDPDKVYKSADALQHQPGKLSPHLYVVPEGEEEHFEDLGDDRKTTGPDQIQANSVKARLWVDIPGERTAKDGAEGHHPAFAWHADDKPDFPEKGIVHFSRLQGTERRLALNFTADENLLQHLRDVSQDSYDPGDMQSRNREISETVKELRDRGYDADQLVASLRTADVDADGNDVGKDDSALPQLPGALDVSPSTSPSTTAPAALPSSAPAGGDNGPHGAPGTGMNPIVTPQPLPSSAPPGGDNGPHGAPGTPMNPITTSDGGPRDPAQPAPAGGGAGGSYTVKPGDTLSGIADSMHDAGGYQDLVKSNPGSMSSGTDLAKNPDLIHPGDVIKGPGGGAGGGAAGGAAGGASAGWGMGSSPLAKSPAAAPLPGIGNAATNGIHAQRFAERYFFADDDSADSDEDKKLNSPENTSPGLNNPPAPAAGGPVGQGGNYKPVSGPGAPAGSPGAQPMDAPRPSSSTNAQGMPMPSAPLHTPENNAMNPDNAAATPGALPAGPAAPATSPGNPGSAPGSAQQKQDEAGATPGAGGLGEGLQSAMSIAEPLMSGIGQIAGPLASGIGGALGSGLSGLTKLLSHDPQRFAAQYMGSGDFLSEGGPNWMDYPFSGSGPDRQDWSTTSEDYIDEHERPNRQDTWHTDNEGDIVKTKSTQPKQSQRREVRRHADMLSGDAGYGGGPGPEVGGGMATAPSGDGGFGSAELPSSGSAPTMGTLTNTAGLSESARSFWADAVDKSDQGYFNPNNPHPHEYDKGEDGLNDATDGGGHGGGGHGAYGMDDGEAAAGDEGLGALAEEAGPLLALAGHDDGSDIVRQFHASGGGFLGNDAGGSGGAFGDDAIAAQAQKFLRTAGRDYTLAQQRELEDEFHPRGARNLKDLDLTGTHYVD